MKWKRVVGQILKFPSAAGEQSLEEGFPPPPRVRSAGFRRVTPLFGPMLRNSPLSICMRRACRPVLPVECEARVGGQASEPPAVYKGLNLGDAGAFLVINKATLVLTICDKVCSSLCQNLEEKEKSQAQRSLNYLWEDRDTTSVCFVPLTVLGWQCEIQCRLFT